MIYFVYNMFIITCVNNFANMSDVVHNGVISIPYVHQYWYTNHNDIVVDLCRFAGPFHEWVADHPDTVRQFKEKNGQRDFCGDPRHYVVKTLLIQCASIAGHIYWHEWIITHDGSAYQIKICRKKQEGDKYIYSNSQIYSKLTYNTDDAQFLTSQFLPGTYIHATMDIDMIGEIPSALFNLFSICHIGGGHFSSRCAKLEESYESYNCDDNSMILLFKGFSERDRFWSPNDKTDMIGANPILSMLFLANNRMELSGKFTSISILDWLGLLEKVCFSMFHY
jgi:hypothetical protein